MEYISPLDHSGYPSLQFLLILCQVIFWGHLPSTEDNGRWPMYIGRCAERSYITFGSLWILITSISVNFCVRSSFVVIFQGHLPSMEDNGRWPMDIGRCDERSYITFGSLWIPMTSISVNFHVEVIFWLMSSSMVIFHQWKMMEDDLWTLEDVLIGLRSSLDRLQYP